MRVLTHFISEQSAKASTVGNIVIHTAQRKGAKKISITGIAKNAKAGAIVPSNEGGIFYIDRINEWDKMLNENVQVSGDLVMVTHGAPYRSGVLTDGLEGDQAIIKKAEIKLYK